MQNKLKIYYYFLREFRQRFLLFLSFSIALSVTQTVLIACLYPFISFSLEQGSAYENTGFILRHMTEFIQRIPIAQPFVCASLLLIILAFFLALFRCLSFSSLLDLTYTITRSLQKKLYNKALNSDIDYFVSTKQGDILFRIKDPPLKVGYIIKDSAHLIRELLTVLFLLLMMLSINIKVTALILIAGGIFGVVIKYASKNIVYKSGMAMTRTLGEEDVILAESLGGIYTIKAHFAERRWLEMFANKVTEYIHHAKRTSIMKETPRLFLESFVIVAIAVSAIIFKGLYSESFKEFMPVFSIYALSILRIIPSLAKISNSGMNIAGLFANMELCYEMLHKSEPTIKNGFRVFRRLEKSIDFKNVTFAYPGGNKLIFENLYLSFKKDEITAIVGKTGAGKTTLVNLLLRFYDPMQGTVEVDGMDLKEIDRASWLGRIGCVSQEPFVFHATIAENITFGECYSRERFEEAARQAGVHQFVMGLKDGYQTIVGEKGMRLSGGEKQRIAIARALLREPQVLIFDEATSALDRVTEMLIQDAILKLASFCAVIIIAHRLSTVRIAHKILVFDNGRLLEEGTHEDLLRAKNHYSRLYMMA